MSTAKRQPNPQRHGGTERPSPRFILDGMLGALARWLRICGYDSDYARSVPDEELIELAASEGRILLTSDRLLHGRAVKRGAESLVVEGGNSAEMLASVSRRFGLELNPEGSLCPKCGETMTPSERGAVEGRVPARTLEAYDEFWICGSCGQVYWRGSHWRNIVETVAEASRLASEAERPEHP